jgi:hypothetical protein
LVAIWLHDASKRIAGTHDIALTETKGQGRRTHLVTAKYDPEDDFAVGEGGHTETDESEGHHRQRVHGHDATCGEQVPAWPGTQVSTTLSISPQTRRIRARERERERGLLERSQNRESDSLDLHGGVDVDLNSESSFAGGENGKCNEGEQEGEQAQDDRDDDGAPALGRLPLLVDRGRSCLSAKLRCGRNGVHARPRPRWLLEVLRHECSAVGRHCKRLQHKLATLRGSQLWERCSDSATDDALVCAGKCTSCQRKTLPKSDWRGKGGRDR